MPLSDWLGESLIEGESELDEPLAASASYPQAASMLRADTAAMAAA
jgi:hypothetical protein